DCFVRIIPLIGVGESIGSEALSLCVESGIAVEMGVVHVESSTCHVATQVVQVENRYPPVKSGNHGRNADCSCRKLNLSCSNTSCAGRKPVSSCKKWQSR